MPLEIDPLARECDALCRYLTGQPASASLRGWYAAGHGALLASGPDTGTIDRILLAVARSGRLPAQLADAYAAVFRRRSLLRCKLILLLALLENDAAHHARYDEGVVDGRLAALLKLAAMGAWWGARLGVATLLFAPLQLVATLVYRSPRGG